MPVGEGKYDSLCTVVRDAADARAAIVLIIDGKLGSGFSVQTRDERLQHALPAMLETMAKEIRDSLRDMESEAKNVG